MSARAFSFDELTARFWARFQRNAETGCLEWTRHCTTFGYGKNTRILGEELVHRISYTLTYGLIPDGLWVLHRCDNPKCGNPEHLFLGTHQDNQTDAKNKGRFPTGDKNYSRRNRHLLPHGDAHHARQHPERMSHGIDRPLAKLCDDSVRRARTLYASGGYTLRQLAIMFGVARKVMGDAVNRRTWKHVI